MRRSPNFVPVDFNPDDDVPLDALASDSWLSEQAHSFRARAVVVLVDACREGVRVGFRPTRESIDGVGTAEAPLRNEMGLATQQEPTVAFIYSCSQGKTSGADKEGECSAFTRALAEIVEARNERVTLAEICDDAQSLLNKFGASNNGSPQLAERGGPDLSRRCGSSRAQRRICDRVAASEWRSNSSRRSCTSESDRSPDLLSRWRRSPPPHKRKLRSRRRLCHGSGGATRGLGCASSERPRPCAAASRRRVAAHAAEAAVLIAVPLVYEMVLATIETGLAARERGPRP